MAKIYEWIYKTDRGQIIADNLKEAKRQVANKFGNAIKIPRGTTIKKIGLSDNKPPIQIEKNDKEDRVEVNKPIKPVQLSKSDIIYDIDTTTQTFGGVELKNPLILQNQLCINGDISFVCEINGHKSMCYISDESELTLPAKTKIWRLSGQWVIV